MCALSSDGKARHLFAQLKEQGWKVERTSKMHYRLVPPVAAHKVIFMSGTPSDYRAFYNLLAKLRRAGAEV